MPASGEGIGFWGPSPKECESEMIGLELLFGHSPMLVNQAVRAQ
jgi:hypothetical protein